MIICTQQRSGIFEIMEILVLYDIMGKLFGWRKVACQRTGRFEDARISKLWKFLHIMIKKGI